MEPVEPHIRKLIHQQGRITFARFMEAALFSPGGGYYTSPRPVGAHGDFFTSPASHPLFGALIAIQLEQMWELLGKPATFTVVEPGAGSGLLGRDILSFSRSLARGFSEALEYVTVERFTPERGAGDHGSWVVGQDLPLRSVTGCILSNELLDSMPVHRFQIQGGRALEVFVTLREERLEEVLDEPSTEEIPARVREAVGDGLPEGFRGELNLGLEAWATEVARTLDRGFVLTVDYGGTAKELYAADRAQGTLRCYYKHTVSGNPYVRLGRQDITSHVDFSTLREVGEQQGLTTLGYATQREFLQNLGAEAFLQALARRAGLRGPSDASSSPDRVEGQTGTGRGEAQQGRRRLSQRELSANRIAMLGLLRVGGMGDFKVLAQGTRVGKPFLFGFQRGNPRAQALLENAANLEVPLRDADRVPLLEGRYPHQAFDPEELWPWGQEEPRT